MASKECLRGSFIVVFLTFIVLSLASTIGLSAEKQVTLEFWHIWTGARQPILREALDRFEARYPHIKVNDVVLTSSTRAEKILVASAAGLPPDVAMIGLADSALWGPMGLFAPLEPLAAANNTDLRRKLYPNVVQGITVGDHIYYIPHVMSVLSLTYGNADLLDAGGVDSRNISMDLATLQASAKKLTRSDGNQLTQIGMNVFGGPGGAERAISFRIWLHLMGGSLYDKTGTKATLATPVAQKTLQWMSDFNDAVVGGAQALSTWHASTTSLFQTNFRDRKSALFIWQDFYYGQAVGVDASFDLVMDLPPYESAVARRSLIEPGWGYGISSGCKNPKEAWLLLEWLTMEAEGGGAFAQSQSRTTASPAINASSVYHKANPYWDRMIQAFNMGTFTNLGPAGVKHDDVLKQLINNAIFQPTAGISVALEEAERLLQVQIDAALQNQ